VFHVFWKFLFNANVLYSGEEIHWATIQWIVCSRISVPPPDVWKLCTSTLGIYFYFLLGGVPPKV
jgi:hypothetical protein